ncbi:c-type cytochrome domain-containing protein [Membranihabitans marinus]|uniref:c-type cytochrome domain-containing protein n=1 Tax=Membranihabitans marinus TaxID=1227546 RepID=UPI001F39EBA5|nr:c-type cytochrome domain-containing protein [Membranihabitans marinus]
MGKIFGKLVLVNFGLDVLIVFFLLAEQWISLPSLLEVVGRAHPLILHFPIVLVSAIPFLPFLFRDFDAKTKLLRVGDYFKLVHFFCAFTILAGLFLSQESGYAGESVDFHKWLSVCVLCGVILLEQNLKLLFRERQWVALSSVVVISLLIAGHMGAGLTHGSDFLTEPLMAKSKQRPAFADADLYQDIVFPILDQKCISCHNNEKSKGDLVLLDSVSIFKGGKNGEVLIPGNSDKSPFIQRLVLDLEDEDHMPPKGKMQLTHEEIDLLKNWVSIGSPFQLAIQQLSASDTVYQMAQAIYGQEVEQDQYDFSPTSAATIEKLTDNYRLLTPIANESPALYGRFLSRSHFKSSQLKELKAVENQLVDLNLSNMPVTDDDLKELSNFRQLQVLNLNYSKITDIGLNALKDLGNLQILSVIGTEISSEGIKNFLTVNSSIKKLYLWGTKITEDELKDLAKRYSDITLVGKSNPFGDRLLPLNPPKVEPDLTFFLDTMRVKVGHPIPNVDIRYTTDGSEPDSIHSLQYTQELLLDSNVVLKFKVFKQGWLESSSIKREFYQSAYTPDTSWLENSPHRNYLGDGILSMIDLKAGDLDQRNKAYLGYRNVSFKSVYEFNSAQPIKTIVVSGLHLPNSYIFPPKEIVIYAKESDGSYRRILSRSLKMPDKTMSSQKYFQEIDLPGQLIAGLKLEIIPFFQLPDWHRGRGEPAWIFIDEVLFR